MKTIIVTDKPDKWKFAEEIVTIVSATDYLTSKIEFEKTPLRVINLCSNYQYQTYGYYVSLLATARGQKVIPGVIAIEDIKNTAIFTMQTDYLNDEIQKTLKPLTSDNFTLSVYFGQNIAKYHTKLAKKLYNLFPLPLFRVQFKFKKKWRIQNISAISVDDIPESHEAFFHKASVEYFEKKRFRFQRKKSFFYDMAILVNSDEKTPPSDEKAINKFIEAAEKHGIHAETIERDSFRFIAEYDALFIRETTSVNHHTYRIARRAAAEGLVVMDSPNAIVRCSNKVYLAELLKKYDIKTPETLILNRQDWQKNIAAINFPCVLKIPDSAFSQGVVKVDSPDRLVEELKKFFKCSDMIVIQEYMPSEFDWRIGILDGEPLFACHYYMAKDHWQIYNWQATRNMQEGDTDCVAIENVPNPVIQTALKAAKLIGNELYGVDLKEVNSHAYVIEINDNPSIEYGIEDEMISDLLYEKIILSFLNRMKKSYGQQ